MAIYVDNNLKELPIYGASRLGIYYRSSETSVYQLTDHLGSVRAIISKNGNNAAALVGNTDYYPFGMPMPNRQVRSAYGYRYEYQGQEKDPETGKEAFQLRLWDGRIGRWLTTDPKRYHFSPYLGMGNNPIIFVDPDGGRPTPYEAALMAANVYDRNVELDGGWARSTINNKYNHYDKAGIGLKAIMYERERENGDMEYAYVYAGTVNGVDWKNNAEQIIATSEQYNIALKTANRLSVDLSNLEVTFVGHSLGGGLANYSSLGTGRSSITFNPAWVSKLSMGKVKKHVKQYPIPSGYRNEIQQTNYVHRSDPLNKIQQLQRLSLNLLERIGKDHFFGNPFLNPYSGHSINRFTTGTFNDNTKIKSPRYF
jgi:RHS repeat-associated protein